MTTKVDPGSNDMEEKVPESNVTDVCENEKNCAGIEQSTASTENTSPESENPTSDSKPTAEEENSSPVESAAVSATDDYNGNNDGERTVDESTENCEETETQKGATGTEARDAWSPPASEEIEDTQKMEGNLHSEDEKNDEDQRKYINKEKGQSEDSLEHGNRQKRFEDQGCRPKHRPGIQRPYGGNGEERTKEKKKPNKNSQKGENWDESPKESKEKTKKEKKNRSERFNVSDLPDERGQYEYFWRSHCVYSQWYACEFEVEGTKYNCAEQYMMHQKAVLMKDDESAEIIMALDEPREMKHHGRYVKNFDQDLWNNSCKDVVKRGNMAKFSQNEKLKETLFSTYPKTLVEASPVDQIWGIGLAKDDRRAWNKQTWRGQNLLGEILTEVRDTLFEQEGFLDPVTVVPKAEHGD